MLTCDTSTEDKTAPATSLVFINRWDKIKQSKDVQFYDGLHSDLCNVPKFLLPVVNQKIKLTKAQSSFYLMNATADCKKTFKSIGAKIFVKRMRPHPELLSTQIIL